MNLIWKVSYFSFCHGVTSTSTVAQVKKDLPRSHVLVNNIHVNKFRDLIAALGSALMQKSIIPLLTQASCALLVYKLTEAFPNSIVRDGGEKLVFHVTVTKESFCVDIEKSLVISDAKNLNAMHILDCSIHISSELNDVLITANDLL